jgi:hypothetical protein
MFRIGHLGDCNDLTLMAALSGCEMGLKLSGVKLAGSGVQAAMDYFAGHPVPQSRPAEGGVTAIFSPNCHRVFLHYPSGGKPCNAEPSAPGGGRHGGMPMATGADPAHRAGAHHRGLRARRRHRCAGARDRAEARRPCGRPQVIVENKGGASGVIAADYVAKQPGDGNTLHMAHINSHALMPNLQKLGYDPEQGLPAHRMVGVTPNLLICNADQPAKTVKDLVALCKANPGQVSFGSAGGGSAQHLALEMFMLQAASRRIHVPYKGSGPMLTDLIGGQVKYSFDTMTAATPHVKSGKAIALAQTRLKRAKGHPNVPTMAESGFPGFEATTWYGLVGPGKDAAGHGASA